MVTSVDLILFAVVVYVAMSLFKFFMVPKKRSRRVRANRNSPIPMHRSRPVLAYSSAPAPMHRSGPELAESSEPAPTLESEAVPTVIRRALMTEREIGFWHRLRQSAKPLHVVPQVAMNALLDADHGLNKWDTYRTRDQFQNKVVDFALVDDESTVQLLVELDDRTHVAEKDDKRDRMTARAGYCTLRITGAPANDVRLLRQAIFEALGMETPRRFSPAALPTPISYA